MIQITADTRRAVVTNKELLTVGSAGIQVEFTLSEDWGSLSKLAVFRVGDDGTKVDVVLGTSLTCVVPPEVLTQEGEVLFIGIYGTNGQGTVIIPTVWASAGVVKPGTEPNTPASAEPTPVIWAQILGVATDAEQTAADAMSNVEAGLQELSGLENTVQNAEDQRQANEQVRIANETERNAAETERSSAENSREVAETERLGNETTRQNNESARVAAETARASAETSRASAEEERAAAEAIREANYATYVETVSGYADAASTSAYNASVSASAASTYAGQASASASSAAGNASAASSSATSAAGYATTAGTHAGTATTKAQEAAASAAAASDSATTATSAKNAAETAQGAAEAAQAAAEEAQEAIEDAAAQIEQNTQDIADLEDEKQDKPATAGTAGQVLGLDANLDPVWVDQTSGGVTSVNGKTGAVQLDAGDIEFADSETYAAGSIGAEVSQQKNAISQNEGAIGELEKDVWDSFDYGFTDNVTSGVDYKGYANGKKVEVEIPINETFLLNVETNAFQKFTLYIRGENSQSFFAYGEYNTNAPVTIKNDSQYKFVELTLWAKAADVTSTGSFAFNVSIDNPNGLAARMSTVETDITEIASEVENIQAELSGVASYSITDNVTAGSEYKGYINGKKIEVTIPYEMPTTFRVNTDCFARYKVYVYTDDTTYYALPDYSNVGEDNHVTAGYMGETYKKITLYIPRINDLTQQNNITSSGTFTFTVSFKEETEYDIINLNPKNEMLSKIQNGRVSVEVSGRTGANRPKCLTLAHFSDIHADATNLSRVIEFCGAYTDYLDDIVCTGDLVRDHAIADGVEEDFTFWDDCGAENVLSVIGNHDTAAITNGTIDWRGFGQLNTYNKYFAPFIANWNVTQPQNASTVGKCYYYKDYSDYNIRLIVLDCMYYDQAQDDWFASVLESARTSGYAVIVCAHSIGKSGAGINCVFNSLIGDAGPVIVDTSTYIYNANVHTKVDAFISAGGTFICFLGGHFHKDHFGLVSDTVNPQPYILVDTAAYNAPLRDHAVVKFERSQDCFNFVSFDTALHLIKIVRVGYQHDCWMREKNPIAYDYENHTLI